MIRESFFVNVAIKIYLWFISSIYESFIVKLIGRMFNFVVNFVKKSFIFSVLNKISNFFFKISKESFFVGVLSCNWDEKAGTTNSLFNKCAIGLSEKLGSGFENSNGIIGTKIKDSFFYKILDENMLLLLIYLIIFITPFAPTMILAFISVGCAVIYLINVMLGRIKISTTSGVKIFALLFLATYLVGALISYNVSGGLQTAFIFILFSMMFFMITSVINTPERLQIVINTIIISGVIVALYGIYQRITGVVTDKVWLDTKEFGEITRIYSTFNNPNVLGEYLIVISSICLGMVWKSDMPHSKVFYFVCFAISGLCLFMTSSRGAMIGFLIAVSVFVILVEKRLIIFGIIGLALMPFILPDSIWRRIISVATLSDTSSLYRISIYKAGINIIKDFWKTGIGVGAFGYVYPIYAFDAAYAYHSHNIYLQVFIELGIVGFTAFIGLLLLYVQKLYYGCRNVVNSNKYLIGLILGGFIGLMFQGVTDYLWFDYRIVLFFWVLIGIGVATVNVAEKNN